MTGMRRLVAIMRKEALHIVRDPRALAVTLAMPLFQLLLYSLVLTFDVNHIPTVVLDMDKTPASRALVRSFESSTYFDLDAAVRHDDVDAALAEGRAQVALVVAPGFGRDIVAGRSTSLQILVDGSDPRVAGIAMGYAQAIAGQHSQKVRLAALDSKGIVLREGFPPIAAERRVWYNPELRSLNYLVPGLLVTIMAFGTAPQIAAAIVVEKERRTLENLVTSPLRAHELILGKITPYLGVAAFQASMITGVAIFGLGVPFRGSVLILVMAIALFVATLLSLGLFVSAIADSQLAATFLAFMVSLLPSFLLSGFIFPIRSMPPFIQTLTYAVPPRYFLTILRAEFLKGAPLSAVSGELTALAGFAAAGLVVSVLTLRGRLD
jgi:ABC-2 type transport system permease protein